MDINEKTRVPLFAVLFAVPTLVGGIYWLTAIWIQGANAAKVNERQDQQIESQKEILIEIRDRIIRIEQKLADGRGR